MRHGTRCLVGAVLLLTGAALLLPAPALAGEPPATPVAQLVPLSPPTLTPTIKDLPAPEVKDDKGTKPPAATEPPEGSKACPKPGILDCMPKVNQPSAPACADWRWIKDHCSGVQVVW